MADFRLTQPDAFAAAVADLLEPVQAASDEAVGYGVREGAKETRKEWKALAPRSGISHADRAAYADSIRMRVDRAGRRPRATVYSTVPGLPHLLEKGHALINGGRAPARPHVAPAAEAGFERTVEAVDERLGELL